ncbi:MAG: TolC family protein [Opitutaceae bacterium]
MKAATRLLACILLGAGIALADPAPNPAAPLTLRSAIATVLARYPTLDAAQAAVDAAGARAVQAGSARLPQVSLGGQYTYTTLRPAIAFGSTVFYTTIQNLYDGGVTVRQLLTDFGHTDALVAEARAGRISAEDALESVRQQLGYETIQSFYSVLVLQRSVGVADEEIRALDEALRISDRKYTGGTATKFDVLTTQVRLAEARNRRSDTVASLDKQEALLRQLLGAEPDAPLDVVGDFPPDGPLPSLSESIAAGLENRPERKLAIDGTHTADLRLEAARREDRPTLSALAEGGVENGQLPALYANRGYFTGGVGVSVPLFTGRRIAGDRREARADLRSARDRVLELDRTIATDVSDAIADLRAARARLGSADLVVAQADEALALARTRYANGVITNFELLDAESADRSARLSRLQARYDGALARQALARAMGDPPRP